MKSADNGNGVTFRSGDDVDLGPTNIGVSVIDTALQMVRPGDELMLNRAPENVWSAIFFKPTFIYTSYL